MDEAVGRSLGAAAGRGVGPGPTARLLRTMSEGRRPAVLAHPDGLPPRLAGRVSRIKPNGPRTADQLRRPRWPAHSRGRYASLAGCHFLLVIRTIASALQLWHSLRAHWRRLDLPIAGPRIDPATPPAAQGLDVRPYVHDLYRHLATCDPAIVQGGLTTAMELTANRRPFIYFPLKHHFEQNFHVRHRQDRYRAGRRMEFDDSPPEAIGHAVAQEIGSDVDHRRVLAVVTATLWAAGYHSRHAPNSRWPTSRSSRTCPCHRARRLRLELTQEHEFLGQRRLELEPHQPEPDPQRLAPVRPMHARQRRSELPRPSR
jgi:hypothetical protein